MPKFTLEVSAQLENVGSIGVPEDYPWHIMFRCGNCGEQSEKPVVISESDEVEGIRGATVNLKMSCKLCGRVNDVKLLPDKHRYTSDHAPDWAPLIHLECRGTEPVEIGLADDMPLHIVGVEDFEFEEAFVMDGEFYSYDEKCNTEASVTEFQTRIVKG